MSIAMANTLLTRDSGANPRTKAGTTLAIILGTVIGGLVVLFIAFGTWLYVRWRRAKRREQAEGGGLPVRDSVDTVIDYSKDVQGTGHELHVLPKSEEQNGVNGNGEHVPVVGNDNAHTNTGATRQTEAV